MVREQKNLTKQMGGWDDWLKLTQQGVGMEIQITLTEKGKKLDVSKDPSYARFKSGSFRIMSVASNEELQKDFDRYRLVTGLHRAEWTEESKQVLRLLGRPLPSESRKFRALFKFDRLAGGWKFITADNAGANEEFPSNYVQKALDAHR